MLWPKNLLFEALVEVDDVVLAESFEHFDLTHGSLFDNLVIIWLFEFLNRNWESRDV